MAILITPILITPRLQFAVRHVFGILGTRVQTTPTEHVTIAVWFFAAGALPNFCTGIGRKCHLIPSLVVLQFTVRHVLGDIFSSHDPTITGF